MLKTETIHILKIPFIALLLLITFSNISFATCYLRKFQSSTGKIQSAGTSPDIKDYLEIVQNAPPVSYNFTARVSCKISTGSTAIQNLNWDKDFEENKERIERDFRPTLTQGTAKIVVYSNKETLLDGTSNIFTGERAGKIESSIKSASYVDYSISFTIPAIQLKSDELLTADKIDPKGYQTGGFMLRMNDVHTKPDFFFYLYVKIKPTTMDCTNRTFDATLSRSRINFGSLAKSDLKRGKQYQQPFAMTITKKPSNCTRDIVPKITFESANLLDNHAVDLYNGTVLRLKDEDGELIEFGQPVGKKVIPGDHEQFQIQNQFQAEIRHSPRNDDIKEGHFSTTLIYKMEYH